MSATTGRHISLSEHHWDQTWIPYGARAKRLAGLDDHDVLDDEIGEWLAPLYAKTKQVVFVSDSCHSASVSRAPLIGVRAAPEDPRPHPLARRPFQAVVDPGVRIGAARDIETAAEDTVDTGRVQGLFTWYWVQALEQAQPGETWEDVFKRAETSLVHSDLTRVSQRPQLQGHGNRTVFGGRFVARQPTVPISQVNQALRTVEIGAGAVSGVTMGSQYQHHDPAGPGRSELPALEITEVDPFVSAGKLLKGEFQVGDLVVESAHAYPLKPIRLAVEGDLVTQQDRGLAQRLRQALGGMPGFQVSTGRSDADWIVYLLRPERNGRDYVYASTQHTLPRPSLQQPPEAWVINRQEKLLHERMRVPLSDAEAGLATLKDNLQRFARVQEIKQLDARSSRPALTVTVALLRPDPSCKTDCREIKDRDKGTQTYRQFDPVKLESLATQRLQVEDILTFALKNEDPEGDYYCVSPRPQSGWRHSPRFSLPRRQAGARSRQSGGGTRFEQGNGTAVGCTRG